MAPIVTDEGTLFRVLTDSDRPLLLQLHGRRTLTLEGAAGLREVFVEGVAAGQVYTWAFDPGQPLLDPYALAVEGPERFGQSDRNFRSLVVAPPPPLDFERPHTPLERSVLYELHVRGYTNDPDCDVAERGTYAGLVSRIPYLVDLGITAIELLPVHEFDEHEVPRGEGRVNFWGYSPISWFAPNRRYAASAAEATGPIDEFRAMVLAFHRAGIEVITDVVYNHTGELGRDGPTRNLRGLAPSIYYLSDEEGAPYKDLTGCGNTVNANHPVVSEMILASLRWWVHGLGVDGFRFDLASILARDEQGELLERAPLVRAIETDPWLRDIHLITEPWDAAGGYLVDRWSGGDRWAVWNDRFRDDVRAAWLRKPASVNDMATRLSGSKDLFGGFGSGRSLNYLTAHDGFTLRDAVSYDRKHNQANGEDNRDGNDHEPCANHGAEGPTDDPAIRRARERTRRNLMASLLLSQGVPMLLAGDEFGRTQQGNNNAYCHDSPLAWVRWADLVEDSAFHRFTRGLIRLRRSLPALQRAAFLEADEVTWLEADGEIYRWGDPAPRPIGCRLAGEPEMLLLVNPSLESAPFAVPAGAVWKLLVDTAGAPPVDYIEPAVANPIEGSERLLEGRSLVLLVSE